MGFFNKLFGKSTDDISKYSVPEERMYDCINFTNMYILGTCYEWDQANKNFVEAFKTDNNSSFCYKKMLDYNVFYRDLILYNNSYKYENIILKALMESVKKGRAGISESYFINRYKNIIKSFYDLTFIDTEKFENVTYMVNTVEIVNNFISKFEPSALQNYIGFSDPMSTSYFFGFFSDNVPVEKFISFTYNIYSKIFNSTFALIAILRWIPVFINYQSSGCPQIISKVCYEDMTRGKEDKKYMKFNWL